MMLAHDIHKTPRTRDVQISHNITFDTMLLAPETLQGLKSAGFHKPSPIQLHGIPLGKCGFDLLLEAKSGTGKTAVFTVIALEKLDLEKGLQVVMLAPTREIAAQICDVIKLIGSEYKGLQVEVVMGGLPVQEDVEKFKKIVHIVVASPGRLLHLIKDKHIDTSCVRLLVLDEADKLVEKSFQEDVKHIFSYLPTQKQVIMSSATYTETAKSFIMNFMQHAQHVCPDSNCVLLGVDQKISMVKYNINIVKQTQHRFQEVLKIFSKMQFKQCLIFCNYQVRVSEIHKLLLRAKWPAEQLYGNQEQTDRLDALKTLQEYKCRILIATDLAARGIDASNIDLVINFEPPLEWQTYLHRIGRAGRYGSYGTAITILSEGTEAKKFHRMLEPMKETINITDLWCNDEITLNRYDSSTKYKNDEKSEVLYKNKEIKQEFQELWRTLICEETADQKNFESFDKLCASFDDNNTDIQTFDELLQSFEDNQVYIEEDLKFKHIDINSEQSKDMWVSLKKYLNNILEEHSEYTYGESYSTNITEPKCYQLECKDKLENNFNDSITQYIGHTYSIEKSNGNRCNDEDFINSVKKIDIDNKDTKSRPTQGSVAKTSYKVENSNNCTDSNNICTRQSVGKYEKGTNDSLYDTEKSLIEAGLPTAFGKPNKIRCSLLSTNQKKDKKMLPSQKTHARQLDQLSLHIQSDSTNNNSSSSDTKYYNDHKNLSTFNNVTHNFNKQKSHNIYTKGVKPKPRTANHSGHYAYWYRQLKLQTKQIELAIYINELSKRINQ